jgi:hypothetical protein
MFKWNIKKCYWNKMRIFIFRIFTVKKSFFTAVKNSFCIFTFVLPTTFSRNSRHSRNIYFHTNRCENKSCIYRKNLEYPLLSTIIICLIPEGHICNYFFYRIGFVAFYKFRSVSVSYAIMSAFANFWLCSATWTSCFFRYWKTNDR